MVVYQYTMYTWWCIRPDVGGVPVHYVHVVVYILSDVGPERRMRQTSEAEFCDVELWGA